MLTVLLRSVEQQGVTLIAYLDDFLIIADSQRQARAAVAKVLSTFTRLGIVPNLDKSQLMPSQNKVQFLGNLFTTSPSLEFQVAPHRVKHFLSHCRQLLKLERVSARSLASILGKLSSMSEALFPTRIHVTHLHQLQIQAMRKGWDHLVPFSKEAKTDLRWWKANIKKMNGRTLCSSNHTLVMDTDASNTRWGAVLYLPTGTVACGEFFTPERQLLHINTKELLAPLLAIRACAQHLKDQSLLLRMDNITATFYVNRFGGRNHGLSLIAERLWKVATRLGLQLEALYLPGEENQAADRESWRAVQLSDYHLHKRVFLSINRTFGPIRMDLFATARNRTAIRELAATTGVDMGGLPHSSLGPQGRALRPPPVLFDFSNPAETLQGESRPRTSGPVLALPAVVPPANEDAGSLASPPASGSRSDGVPVGEHANATAVGDNRLADLRKALQDKGLSATLASQITERWKEGDYEYYQRYWAQWYSFARTRNVAVFDPSREDVGAWMSALLADNVAGAALNKALSAINVPIYIVSNKSFAGDELLKTLKKVARKRQPTTRRRHATFDVSTAFSALRADLLAQGATAEGNFSQVKLLVLRNALIVLHLLDTGHRGVDLNHVYREHISLREDSVEFSVLGTKSDRNAAVL